MNITIKINTDDAALQGTEYSLFNTFEFKRILKRISHNICGFGSPNFNKIGKHKLYDINGNSVGYIEISDGES